MINKIFNRQSNNKKNRFNKSRKVVKNRELDLTKRELEKTYEASSTVKAVVLVITLVLISLPIIQYYLKKDKLVAIEQNKRALKSQAKALEERRVALGDQYLAYIQRANQGDVAFEKKDYFKAIFYYKQARSFNVNSLEINKKLLQVLELTCSEEYPDDCIWKEKVMQTIQKISSDHTLESLEDKRDSILIEIRSGSHQ